MQLAEHVCDNAPDTEPVELNTLSAGGDTLEPIPLVFIEGWAAGTSAKIFSGLDDLLNEQKTPDDQPRRMLVIKYGSHSLLPRPTDNGHGARGNGADYEADAVLTLHCGIVRMKSMLH